MSDSTMTNTMLRKNDLKLKIAVYVVSIAIVLLILLPFVLMMAENVLHPETYTMDSTGRLTKIVYNNVSVINSFKNSMLVTVGATFLNVYFSSLTAYAITAYEWKLKTVFSNLITAFMMLPNTIALIGFYQLTWKFHLINNLMMLILPAVASNRLLHEDVPAGNVLDVDRRIRQTRRRERVQDLQPDRPAYAQARHGNTDHLCLRKQLVQYVCPQHHPHR